MNRYLLAETVFSEIDIYEQRASCGGCWNYTQDLSKTRVDVPQTNPHLPPEEPTWPENDEGREAECKLVKQPIFVSPMYDRLETNIPHTLMAYSDDLSFEDNQLFPSREDVLQYLKDYARDVRHLIKFQTQVTEVHRDESSNNAWVGLSKYSLVCSDRITNPKASMKC